MLTHMHNVVARFAEVVEVGKAPPEVLEVVTVLAEQVQTNRAALDEHVRSRPGFVVDLVDRVAAAEAALDEQAADAAAIAVLDERVAGVEVTLAERADLALERLDALERVLMAVTVEQMRVVQLLERYVG